MRTESVQTGEFVAFRIASTVEESDSPKKKRYAKRSKEGCVTCRRRHIRCDESRPICQRCTKAQVSCVYPTRTTESPDSTTTTIQPQASLSVFKAPDEREDLQFWLEVGGANAGRWQCPSFYEHLLPQFSQAYESARYSLLALSTCVRQWHLSDESARAEALARGDHYYSLACKQLLSAGDSKASTEAALVSSMALFFYDSFTDHMARRYIHSNAAISLLQLLKQGLSYNEVSGWRSDTGKAGAQVVIETAEAYFDEISYPALEGCPDESNKGADTASPDRTKLYVPIWLELDHQSGVLTSDQILLKPESVDSILESWTTIQAAPTTLQECHAYLTLWHCWLYTWLINTLISADALQSSQSLCRQWHIWLFGVMRPGTTEMLSMQNRALILDELFELKLADVSSNDGKVDIQPHIERMLALITSNIKMSRPTSESPPVTSSSHFHQYWQRQYLRGLAKVIEYILRRADDERLREQVYALFRFQIGPKSSDEPGSAERTGPHDPTISST